MLLILSSNLNKMKQVVGYAGFKSYG